jgi:hypothetical protein
MNYFMILAALLLCLLKLKEVPLKILLFYFMDIWINNLLLKDGEKDYTHINLPLWMESFMHVAELMIIILYSDRF